MHSMSILVFWVYIVGLPPASCFNLLIETREGRVLATVVTDAAS